MSLRRALSSLLTRRFSPPRRIPVPVPAAQAETSIGSASSGRRPTRSLHTLTNNNLDARGGALAAVAGAGVAALVGFLYLKKHDKAGEEANANNMVVTHMKAALNDSTNNMVLTDMKAALNDPTTNKMVVTDMKAALNDPTIMAMFTDKDGNVAWMRYNDYLHFRMEYLDEKKSDTDKEAIRGARGSGKVNEAEIKKRFDELRKEHDKVTEDHMKMIMEQKRMVRERRVDEAAMTKRFEAWMKEYGRTYKGREKARRYEAFKVNALIADKLDTLGGARFRPGKFADWTEAELEGLCSRHGDFDWESYFEELRTMYAGGGRMLVDPQHCTDAVKRFRELEAQKDEQERQANKQ